MSIYRKKKGKDQLKTYMSMDKFPTIEGYDFDKKFDFNMRGVWPIASCDVKP